MNDFWEMRFGEQGYAYGIEPNAFFSRQLQRLEGGKVLFPAEGEGRNAVYAARKGYEAYAFDFSLAGQKKALALAERYNVNVDYSAAQFETVVYPNEYFDAIVLIFAHMPAQKRQLWHRKLTSFLRKDGLLIIEGFSKDQLQYGSGGPPVLDMLFSEEELIEDFAGLRPLSIKKHQTVLDEGAYHKGEASVVSGVFQK
jgi:ubiquinone/menaquinone biosynthesis C-methylase UbiE